MTSQERQAAILQYLTENGFAAVAELVVGNEGWDYAKVSPLELDVELYQPYAPRLCARPTLYHDIVNHMQYGREWLIRFFCTGDRARAQAMADETVVERKQYYEQFVQLDPATLVDTSTLE